MKMYKQGRIAGKGVSLRALQKKVKNNLCLALLLLRRCFRRPRLLLERISLRFLGLLSGLGRVSFSSATASARFVGSSDNPPFDNLGRFRFAIVLLAPLVTLGVFGLANPARASTLFGVSGSTYESDVSTPYGQGVNIGGGYTGNLKVFDLAVNDDKSATYYVFELVECTTYEVNVAGSGCTNASSYTYISIASNSLTADFQAIAQKGGGRRSVEANFSYYLKQNNNTGATTANSWATTPIALNSSHFYWLRILGLNSKALAHSLGSGVGNISLYGIQTTLKDVGGHNMFTAHNVNMTSVDSKIGTAYHYGADAPLVWGDTGFYTPSSSSSQSSLSGAGSFCAGVASSSYAFGIPYGFCYISAFLFVPSQESIQSFYDNAGLVKNVPPWSYALEVKDAWDYASSTSQTFPKVTIPWNVFGTGSATLTLISSASYYKYVSANTWATARGFTTVFMYFGFGFYLWRRGRRILSEL